MNGIEIELTNTPPSAPGWYVCERQQLFRDRRIIELLLVEEIDEHFRHWSRKSNALWSPPLQITTQPTTRGAKGNTNGK